MSPQEEPRGGKAAPVAAAPPPPVSSQEDLGRSCFAAENHKMALFAEPAKIASFGNFLDFSSNERRSSGVGVGGAGMGQWHRGLEGLSAERCRAWARYLAHNMLAQSHSPPPERHLPGDALPPGLASKERPLAPPLTIDKVTITPTTSPDTPVRSPHLEEGSPRAQPLIWPKRRQSFSCSDAHIQKLLRTDAAQGAPQSTPLMRLGDLGLDLSVRPLHEAFQHRLQPFPPSGRSSHAAWPFSCPFLDDFYLWRSYRLPFITIFDFIVIFISVIISVARPCINEIPERTASSTRMSAEGSPGPMRARIF